MVDRDALGAVRIISNLPSTYTMRRVVMDVVEADKYNRWRRRC